MFGVTVLKDERLVVVVEQKPDCSEELCFKWMSNVIQVIVACVLIASERYR